MAGLFDLDDLIRRVASSDPPATAQHSLVKMLMEISYGRTVEEKVGQVDERIDALRAVEAEVHARIVNHPDLAGKPPSPAPPPSVAREFRVLMALRTALEKLGETRAALTRRLA